MKFKKIKWYVDGKDDNEFNITEGEIKNEWNIVNKDGNDALIQEQWSWNSGMTKHATA